MTQPTTQPSSQYEEELLQEIRQIPLTYLPNLLKIVQLFRDSVSNQQRRLEKEKEEESSLDSLDDMNPKELKALLDIQAQYESKEWLRELLPMRVDFDLILG